MPSGTDTTMDRQSSWTEESTPSTSAVRSPTKTRRMVQKAQMPEDSVAEKDIHVVKKPNNDYHSSLAAIIERNQFSVCKYLLIFIYSLYYLVPACENHLSKWMYLQYPVENLASNYIKPPFYKIFGDSQTYYHIGQDDIYFVFFWIIKLTFLRSAVMSYIWKPIASKLCGIKSQKKITRFAEQGWQNVYYLISFTYGSYMYITESPYFLSMDELYSGWPHDKLSGCFKTYYLITTAFWVHQFLVLHIEEKRKDHNQMFSHHVVTFCLVVGSYYYHFTRIGHLIIMIMDSVDVFLVSAKMLKYIGCAKACDFMFVVFLISWLVLRHGVYNLIFWHALTKSTTLMADGQCGVNDNSLSGNSRCWTPTVLNVFYALLGGLQIITCIWVYFIFKVAYKVVTGNGAEDVRSDENDTTDEGDASLEKSNGDNQRVYEDGGEDDDEDDEDDEDYVVSEDEETEDEITFSNDITQLGGSEDEDEKEN